MVGAILQAKLDDVRVPFRSGGVDLLKEFLRGREFRVRQDPVGLLLGGIAILNEIVRVEELAGRIRGGARTAATPGLRERSVPTKLRTFSWEPESSGKPGGRQHWEPAPKNKPGQARRLPRWSLVSESGPQGVVAGAAGAASFFSAAGAAGLRSRAFSSGMVAA